MTLAPGSARDRMSPGSGSDRPAAFPPGSMSPPGPSESFLYRGALSWSAQRDPAAPPTMRLGFKAPTRNHLAPDAEIVGLRDALQRGLFIDLSSKRSIEARLIALLIGPSNRIEGWPCKWYSVRPGTNELPSGELAGLPHVFDTTSYSKVDRLVQADRYVTGDQYPQTDVFLAGDRLPPDLRELLATGVLFGKVSVDWKRQSVLYLAVVPIHPDEAVATQILPIAFLLNQER